MNTEDIIAMAREVGLPHWYEDNTLVNESRVLKFAALVAAAEREACAKLCEDFADQDSGPDGICTDYHARLIRARGEQK